MILGFSKSHAASSYWVSVKSWSSESPTDIPHQPFSSVTSAAPYRPYTEFTTCTELFADHLRVPWPNQLVEDTFVRIHAKYFQDCLVHELYDPPPSIIFVLVMTPICLIPVMVTLVVLKTKNGDSTSWSPQNSSLILPATSFTQATIRPTGNQITIPWSLQLLHTFHVTTAHSFYFYTLNETSDLLRTALKYPM